MLSKSQARWFFIGGTIFFFAIFLFLTVDTLREIPARQNSDAMNDSVVRGKHMWDSNNCMGCHTILGEGAYYAPELTKVVERRGKEWLAEMPSTRLLVSAARLIRAGVAPRAACNAAIIEALTDDAEVAEGLRDLVALAF
jgi:mono/diheme cytochrome c family protein